MEKYPKQVRLKDDSKLVLRPMRSDDRERLHAFFCALSEEDRLYLRDDVTDWEVINRWTLQMDHDKVLPILALQGDLIVGDATLHMDQFGWTKHVGEVRCVVARELQNKGLGTILVGELVLHALHRKLKKVSVMMMECQQDAHRTFERIGFRKAASLPGYVVDIDGREHDLAILVNEPEDIWRRMQDLMIDLDFRGERSLFPFDEAASQAPSDGSRE